MHGVPFLLLSCSSSLVFTLVVPCPSDVPGEDLKDLVKSHIDTADETPSQTQAVHELPENFKDFSNEKNGLSQVEEKSTNSESTHIEERDSQCAGTEFCYFA